METIDTVKYFPISVFKEDRMLSGGKDDSWIITATELSHRKYLGRNIHGNKRYEYALHGHIAHTTGWPIVEFRCMIAYNDRSYLNPWYTVRGTLKASVPQAVPFVDYILYAWKTDPNAGSLNSELSKKLNVIIQNLEQEVRIR